MEKEGVVMSVVIMLVLAVGFITGVHYSINNLQLTKTETQVITVPYTRFVTVTTTLTINAAGGGNINAQPILNTVYAYKSNIYMVKTNGTTISVYIPDPDIDKAGEIVNFFSWFNSQYITYVYQKYKQDGGMDVPAGNDQNYLVFSYWARNYFKYDNKRAMMIANNPRSLMPLEVQLRRSGICGDFMHFWALLEIAQGRHVTLVNMFPLGQEIGHAFIIDDYGKVIENNGHVLLNTDALIIEWYNVYKTPMVFTYFFADPKYGITSYTTTTIYNAPLVEPKSVLIYTEKVTGIVDNKYYTEIKTISSVNGTAVGKIYRMNKEITSTITFIAQGNTVVMVTFEQGHTISNALPFDQNFYEMSILPVVMHFKNVVSYGNVNGTKIYTIIFETNDTVIAHSFNNTIVATRIIMSNNTLYAVLTYTDYLFYA